MGTPVPFLQKVGLEFSSRGSRAQHSVILLQELCGPGALPFSPTLGDPFQHSPEFLDSGHCFCGLSRWNCLGCGHVFKEICDCSAKCPEPLPTAWTPMDPKAAAAEAEPGTVRETEASAARQAQAPVRSQQRGAEGAPAPGGPASSLSTWRVGGLPPGRISFFVPPAPNLS